MSGASSIFFTVKKIQYPVMVENADVKCLGQFMLLVHFIFHREMLLDYKWKPLSNRHYY